jgi:hypothetical protein
MSDPAFGNSYDEDMHLNDALGQDIDEVGGDCSDEAGTFCITYCVVFYFTYYT